jgi:hypothetical protein
MPTMPRFKLVLQDAAGKTRTATVEAADQADAVEVARRKGYQVRQVEPVYDLADGAPADDVGSAEHRLPGPRSAARPAVVGKQTLLLFLVPTGLAAAAFLLALGTLIYVLVSDPLGSGLGKYDFSSPRAAYLSEMQIDRAADLRARIEYQRKFGERTPSGKRLKEKMDSYELKKEVEYGSRRGLLVSYKSGGTVRREVVWFDKDEKTGYWVEVDIPPAEVRKNDAPLADQIEQFQSTGEVPPKK